MIFRKALIITSKGLGDGLMMMVASDRLKRHGYKVITMNDHLGGLSDWFPGHLFEKELPLKAYAEYVKYFDLVILQNDNTEKSKTIIQLHRKGIIRSLSIFYSSYEEKKHPPLTSWDIVFDPSRPMVENIAKAIAILLRAKEISRNNGIVSPSHLHFRRFERRVIIHPTASTIDRMWPIDSFLLLASKLKKLDFDPIFCLSIQEKQKFGSLIQREFFSPTIENLGDLASLIFESGYVIGNESGIVHLGSNLQIPTLVIASQERRIRLWRPGWRLGGVITPPSWIPNWKFLRMREKYWRKWITPGAVKSKFDQLITNDMP